jgi:hypothetical protein
MGTIAETLFNDYNDYRRETQHIKQLKKKKGYIPSISKKHLPTFEALAYFCHKHDVNPRRWLASLFEVRRWMYPPKLNQLQSTKHLKRYPQIETVPIFRKRIQAEHQRASYELGSVFNLSRDLSNGAEMLKRRFINMGNYARCMSEMENETFGYHPRSEVCKACPERFTCASQLQSKVSFDIMSLRLGLMSITEAQMAAACHGCSS